MRAHLTLALILALTIPVVSSAKAQSPTRGEPAADSSSATGIIELQRKAEAGDPSAAYALGYAYETGKGIGQNWKLAVFWYRNAAEWGDAAAQGALGVFYWLGEGVDKDRKEAVKWYHKAARQGDANAMFNLGAAYYNGEGENIDDTRAYAWFLLAREAGSTAGRDAARRSQSEHGQKATCDAQLSVAEMYEKGVDLPHNLNLAENWYRRAGKDHDCKEAKIRLASLFLNSGNYTDALEWCKAAANENLSGGAFCLGHLYQKGLGVNQDLKGAFQWYKRAANGGDTAAMVALGQMYENGEATKIDRTEATIWLLEAARRGNKDALAEAGKVHSSMTEKEWKETRKRLERKYDISAIDRILQGNNAKVAK
jgi:hypothetical protein